MGACGCADGFGDAILRTKGKLCAVRMIGPCKDCDMSIAIGFDLLDKDEKRFHKECETPEFNMEGRWCVLNVLDFEYIKKAFVEQGMEWFALPKGENLDREYLDVIFDDFVADIIKDAFYKTIAKSLENATSSKIQLSEQEESEE